MRRLTFGPSQTSNTIWAAGSPPVLSRRIGPAMTGLRDLQRAGSDLSDGLPCGAIAPCFCSCSVSATPPTPATLEARKEILRREYGAGLGMPHILTALDGVDDLYFDVVSQIRLDRWSRGRTALVGDAAACVSLLAGEGTGLAMTEAYVLAGRTRLCPWGLPAGFRRLRDATAPFCRSQTRRRPEISSCLRDTDEAGHLVSQPGHENDELPSARRAAPHPKRARRLQLPNYPTMST